MDFCPSFSRLFVQSLSDSDGLGVVFTLFNQTVFIMAVECQYPTVFTSFMLFCGATRMYDLLLKFRHSVRRRLRPIQSRAVTLCNSDNLEVVPIYGVISLFICLFNRSVSCVINLFVVSQCSHDARRELHLSSSRTVESILYQIDPGSILAFSL